MKTLLLLLALISPITCLAQTSPAKKSRTASIICTAIPDELPNPCLIRTGKSIEKVTLSKRRASDPIKIDATGSFEIVKENPDPDPALGASDHYLTLAKVSIPESVRQAMVILFPQNGDTKSDILMQGVVQDLAKFDGGDFMYINLTGANLMVKLGKRNLRVKPRQRVIADAGAITESTNSPTSFWYQDRDSSQWKLISSSTVVIRPTRREVCIFSWDPKYKRISYHGISAPVE